MNCIDNKCKHLYCELGEYYCNRTKKPIPEDVSVEDTSGKPADCKNFEHARTCINCKHSLYTVYETGTIDDIEYRCPFQDKKLIYDDTYPYYEHFADVPECNVGRFEEI